jgi:23S rRNA G2069 N7-methylase RlmK/C1962 C5-methylase RlmI
VTTGHPPIPIAEARTIVRRALDRRVNILADPPSDALRLVGPADGSAIMTIDQYAVGAVMTITDGASEATPPIRALAEAVLELLAPLGVTSIYYKPLPRDRSRLGGAMPAVMTDPTPAAGPPLPEAILVEEHAHRLEVRLYDGFSTGLFFDQRENRLALAEMVRGKRVLNTFAYTGAFSVACALGGAETTTVDISRKYVDWATRNFEHNSIDTARHFFNRMDTFEFFRLARRKNLRYELIILDPPTFAAGSKRDGVAPFSAESDYPKLVIEAIGLLTPRGRIFASTNCRALCERGRFRAVLERAIGTKPVYHDLPPHPDDLQGEIGRMSAFLFSPR